MHEYRYTARFRIKSFPAEVPAEFAGQYTEDSTYAAILLHDGPLTLEHPYLQMRLDKALTAFAFSDEADIEIWDRKLELMEEQMSDTMEQT